MSYITILIGLFVLTYKAEAFEVKTPDQIKDYAIYQAQNNQLDVTTILKVIDCESRFNPQAIGDHGTSIGVAQIHLPAHPDITLEQAMDPIWSINWMIDWITAINPQTHRQNGFGIWSCYSLIT